HRAAPLPRDDRPAAHPRDVLHRPQPGRAAGRGDRARQRGGRGRRDRDGGSGIGRRDRRRGAALHPRQQAGDRRARRQPGAECRAGGEAGRAAPLLLRLRRLPRGHPRLRREASPGLDRPLNLATRLRRRKEERPPDAYGALLRSIVGQQVSTKAARAIYLRVLDLFGGTTPSPAQLLEATEEELRGAGLSGRKVEYIRDLALHIEDGELDLDRIATLPDEEAIAEITAVRGLGRWTAEIFLAFHLGRTDVISGGDLGI